MKKIYTTLLLVLIASLGFAQISTQIVREGKNQLPFQKRTFNTATKAGEGSFWFNYADDLQAYLGVELQYGGSTFLQDSVATIEYSNGNGRPQFYSFAQIFDFTEAIWYDFYDGLSDEGGLPISVPHIKGTSSYSIDSIGCVYAYSWGDNVDPTTVDTLVMTIAATSNMQYQNLTSDGNPAFKQAKLNYNINDATLALPTAPTTYPNFYQVKYPLTINDTTGSSYMYNILPVEGFENITHKTIVVAYSFKSGTPDRDTTKIIGTDINWFSAFYYEDNRPDYNTYGSNTLLSEKSNSMCGMDWSVQTGSWYGKYMSNSLWNGDLKRPGILVHATCDDCAWVGVEETAQKNISVRPNPATDVFTVVLAENTPAQVQLFNIVGQMVFNQTTSEATAKVDVSDLKAGIYMLRVSQNGQTYTSKVVVR